MVDYFVKAADNLRQFDSFFKSDKDPLLTTNLRFAGFCNDLTEALKMFLPRSLYLAGYGVTGTYAVSAVVYESRRFNEKNPNQTKQLTISTLDNVVWHSVATVFGTPLLIILLKKNVSKLLSPAMSSLKKKLIPGLIGVAAIPLIVSPIDNTTTYFINQLRPKYGVKLQGYHWTGPYAFLNKKH
jgi:hypothetical protein